MTAAVTWTGLKRDIAISACKATDKVLADGEEHSRFASITDPLLAGLG